jgi:hypothetical protein
MTPERVAILERRIRTVSVRARRPAARLETRRRRCRDGLALLIQIRPEVARRVRSASRAAPSREAIDQVVADGRRLRIALQETKAELAAELDPV